MKSSIAFAAALVAASFASFAAETSVQSVPDAELQAMLGKYAEAASLFYDGNPEAVKALWSHSDGDSCREGLRAAFAVQTIQHFVRAEAASWFGSC